MSTQGSFAKPNSLTPYLMVSQCKDAMDFYETVFGARRGDVHLHQDQKYVMHASMMVFGVLIFLCDKDCPMPGKGHETVDEKEESPTDARVASACLKQTGGIMMHAELSVPGDVDELMEKAKAHGAKLIWPPEDAFWGQRYGMMVDPFGIVWSVGADLSS